MGGTTVSGLAISDDEVAIISEKNESVIFKRFPGSNQESLLSRLFRLNHPKFQVSIVSCSSDIAVISTCNDEIFMCGSQSNELQSINLASYRGRIHKISTGHKHALLIVGDERHLLGIGEGTCGQLANCNRDSRMSNLDAVHINIPEGSPCIDCAAGFDFSVVCTAEHTFSFGSACHNRLGLGALGLSKNFHSPTLIDGLEGCGPVTLLASSTWHSVAVTAGANNTNEVFVWGWNKFGQCGPDNDELIDAPHHLPLEGEEEIVSVTAGSRHTAILYASGKVLVMGELGVERGTAQNPRVVAETATSISSYQWGLVVVESQFQPS